jgi:hypothetical protein
MTHPAPFSIQVFMRLVAGLKSLTARLAQGIQAAVGDARLRARAATLGENSRAEVGVAQAVALVERKAGPAAGRA